MSEGGQPPGGSQGPRDVEIQALRQQIELLRKDMVQQKTALDGRLSVQDEKIGNLNRIVYGILVVIVVGVIVAIVVRAAGLG